ncbi:MAG TPA: hypothetical protein PLJ35_22225 [Anaerolineae bacterium]|nr:hypothetical protein [Anaerolineae bacterium]
MATNPQTTQVLDDPFDTASKATLAPRDYYGQIQMDAWYCVLVKGKGKVPFDAAQHNVDDRRTAITIALLSLPEQNIQFELARDLIAESREWAGIVWPSLKALGLNSTREAQGKWAKMQQVPSGRKYRNVAGEEKEATTFKFLALYESEEACRAAYLAETGRSSGGNGSNGQGTPATVSSSPSNNGDHALKIALPFIQAFARKEQYDLERTKAACRSQKIITDAIDVDSPEFVQIVAEAMAGSK